MALRNETDIIGQHDIREAADLVVDSVLLKATEQIPDAARVREIRAAVEQQINELILAVREHSSQVSRQSLAPTFSPGQLAKNLGITVDKVLNWIHNGTLEAIDVSTDQQGRPRYRIDAEAIAKFKAVRSSAPPPKPERRKKRQSMEGVIQFF